MTTAITEDGFYHYSECGLGYVYLANGYELHDTNYGGGVSIMHADQLHEAIGCFIVRNLPKLTGKEVRFLRAEMDMSQFKLSKLLGVTEDQVSRWERDKSGIGATADRLIRTFYLAYLDNDENALKICDELTRLQEFENERLEFAETSNGWQAKLAA